MSMPMCARPPPAPGNCRPSLTKSRCSASRIFSREHHHSRTGGALHARAHADRTHVARWHRRRHTCGIAVGGRCPRPGCADPHRDDLFQTGSRRLHRPVPGARQRARRRAGRGQGVGTKDPAGVARRDRPAGLAAEYAEADRRAQGGRRGRRQLLVQRAGDDERGQSRENPADPDRRRGERHHRQKLLALHVPHPGDGAGADQRADALHRLDRQERLFPHGLLRLRAGYPALLARAVAQDRAQRGGQ